MKSVMSFTVAIACGLILSVDVATGSQQADGSKNGEEVFLNPCGSYRRGPYCPVDRGCL